MSSIFSLETRAGEPIQAAGVKLIPQAQSLKVKIPGLSGGLVWNRPVSVKAVTPDGVEQTIPIIDVTRQAQIAIWGMTILAAILMSIFFVKNKN